MPANPNFCNFCVFLWEHINPDADEYSEPTTYEQVENKDQLGQRVAAYKKGGRFAYMWWAEWDSAADDYTIELGEWWRPTKRTSKSKSKL